MNVFSSNLTQGTNSIEKRIRKHHVITIVDKGFEEYKYFLLSLSCDDLHVFESRSVFIISPLLDCIPYFRFKLWLIKINTCCVVKITVSVIYKFKLHIPSPKPFTEKHIRLIREIHSIVLSKEPRKYSK